MPPVNTKKLAPIPKACALIKVSTFIAYVCIVLSFGHLGSLHRRRWSGAHKTWTYKVVAIATHVGCPWLMYVWYFCCSAHLAMYKTVIIILLCSYVATHLATYIWNTVWCIQFYMCNYGMMHFNVTWHFFLVFSHIICVCECPVKLSRPWPDQIFRFEHYCFIAKVASGLAVSPSQRQHTANIICLGLHDHLTPYFVISWQRPSGPNVLQYYIVVIIIYYLQLCHAWSGICYQCVNATMGLYSISICLQGLSTMLQLKTEIRKPCDSHVDQSLSRVWLLSA